MEHAEVAVVEDVWGEPFEALSRDVTVLRRPDAWSDPAELHEVLGTATALVVRNRTRVDAELLDAAPRLGVVLRAGVGLETIDVAAADGRGIVIVAPLGANATSVAEHTLALALALARDLVAHDRAVRAGRWERRPGRELAGGTWGLLGAGATGRAVARLATALDMRVVGYDPFADPEAVAAAGVTLVDLDEVTRAADVLSVHLPATPTTHGLVGHRLLGLVRPHCLLVNVGRGEVVDEAALAEALQAGRLGGAALDVRASEPPAPGPLDDAPGLLLTPHVAGITAESQLRITEAIVGDLRALLAGGTATHAVGAVDRLRPVQGER